MKKTFTLLVIFFLFQQINAQYNESSPWMNDLLKTKIGKKSFKKEFTLEEISNSFNSYWKLHAADKNKKGSGYKPFKRWEYMKSLSLDNNGKIITPVKTWNAWKEKNTLAAKNQTNFSNWENLGPYTQESKDGQGRVNTIIVDPNNPNTYYVGAPAGGLWKSTDSGANWRPLTDHLPQIGVSGIAIDSKNSNIIYIATGDDDHGDTYSIGVLKSTDGGNTWNTTGLIFADGNTFARSNEIYIHPEDSSILWVATSNGLYKTTNAGVTWNKKLSGNIQDLKLKPNNPNVVYAVNTSTFYKSVNGGETFTDVTSNGLPSFSGRLAIDVTFANENIVYVLSAANDWSFQGIYKSTDSGSSFIKTSQNVDIFGSTQAWYDMALTVSDTNENFIFVGVLDIWSSGDGGVNFSRINRWYRPSDRSYTHADIHFLRYFNGNLFCGSDGGIYKSTDNGRNFEALNEGLSISQYYKIAVSQQTSQNIAGGLQDNGGFGYSNNSWNRYHGGDGMDCAVDPNDKNTYYGFSQFGGGLYATYDGGKSKVTITGSPEKGRWVTPLAMNLQSDIYAGYRDFYKLDTDFNRWQKISDGGFEQDSRHIYLIEINQKFNHIIYITKEEILYKSIDGGVNFSKMHRAQTRITSIEVNNNDSSTPGAHDSNIIYLTTTTDVFKSIDGGFNFHSITANLPSEPKNIIVHQPNSLNDLYVGTSLGVYHTNDEMTSWEVYSKDLPNVPITDLEINSVDNVIVASTYGRGVWKSPIKTSTDEDTTPPTTPTNLAASGTTQTTTNLSWIASTDNKGVTGYDIYRGTTKITTVSGTSSTVTGLSPSTSYSFKVKAKDAAGNVSGFSNVVSITTLGAGDDTPAPPTDLIASATSQTTTHLSWTASTTSNIYYVLYKNGRYFTTSNATSYTVSGLSSNTSYSFKIYAKKRGGKSSAASNTVSIITLGAIASEVENKEIGIINPLSAIKVYPNPVKELLTIAIPNSLKGNLSIRLISITGKLILDKKIETRNQKLSQLDVSKIQLGIYILEFRDQTNFKHIKRIVIN